MLSTITEKALAYRSFAQHNFRQIPQISQLSEEQINDIDIVSMFCLSNQITMWLMN